MYVKVLLIWRVLLINFYVSLQKSHCTAFLYKFLKEVNQLMSKDNVNSFHTFYEFYMDTEKHSFTYKIFKDKPEKVMLTPEYIEYCKKETSNSKFE